MDLLTRAGNFYSNNPLVNLVTSLIAAGGLALFQYAVSQTPLTVDVEKSNPKFTPAKARVQQEQLVVVSPSANAVERLMISGEGKEFETIDAYFDSARIHEDVIGLLRTDPQAKLPPTEQVVISYTAASDEETKTKSRKPPANNEEPCRTSLDVGWGDSATLPRELFLIPLAGSQTRAFELQATGSDLVVHLRTSDLSRKMRGPGCKKMLSVGDWSSSFSSPVLIKIVVPSGSKLRFNFTASKGKSLQLGPNGLYEPFNLGARSLSAQAVRLLNVSGTASTSPALDVAVKDSNRPLILRQLLLGINEIQLEFSGVATVQENGKPAVMFDYVEFAKQNPFIAALLGMFYLAVGAWVGTALIKWLKTFFPNVQPNDPL